MFSKLHEHKYNQCYLNELTNIMHTNSANPSLLELSLMSALIWTKVQI